MVVAIILFAVPFVIVSLTRAIFSTNLHIIVPFLTSLTSATRIEVFILLVPFLHYFFTEGLYLHEFHRWPAKSAGLASDIADIARIIGVKSSPYVTLLLIQYFPMYSLNIRLLPSFIGFLIEFFLGVIPLFIVSTAWSWWFYRNTSKLGMDVIFNSLIFAWSAAAVFPLGVFHL